MTSDDRRRLVAAVTAMYAYYDRQVNELHLQFWVEDMAPFPIQAVECALVAHRKDPGRGQFLPKTADIIRLLTGETGDRAVIEWGRVLDCARAGGEGFRKLPQASQQAVDSIGGMVALRRADERQTSWMQRQFLSAYQAYAARLESEKHFEALLGRDGTAGLLQ